MKRNSFIKILENNNCVLLREGSKHSVFYNTKIGRTSTVPRHKEINDFLVKKICRDLSINLKNK
ncbi:type II toxin-antitoxin system HicA family toxin [Patescibacteria group bacterium]|nr:type II toxin-antitoxin system HicA family toxin [Patescibacteria group bacterium]